MQANGKGSREKKAGRALPINRQVILGAATLVTAAALLIIGLYPRTAVAPELDNTTPPENMADTAGTQQSTLVESGCELIQIMTYNRCDHEVNRRIPLPQELVGKSRQDVEAAYDGWRVTEFLPKRVTMTKLLPLYCSQHVVLLPDESGILGVFQNKYGDAMAFVESLHTSLDSLPESIQEEVRLGKGFNTLEELEKWLENVES